MARTDVSDSATIGTSEYSLPGDTSSGVPTSQTEDAAVQCFIDFGAMAAGDQYEVKVYEKVNAGTQRVVFQTVLTGAQSEPILVLPTLELGDGWDITVKKLAGTDRSIGWSLRKRA